MSESLATELLELIVDFVAGDPTQERTADLLSLCLSCKALVPRSQKHIFSDVAVYPPVKDRRPMPWLPPPEYLKRYERTVSFLRTVSQHPHLASHVRALTCNFTAQWLGIDANLHSYILQAFEHMSSIKSLTLAYQDPYGSGTRFNMDEPSVSLSEWMTYIGAMLETRPLEMLTLLNLSGYPGETILRSSNLRHLALCNTKLQPVISSEADGSVTAKVPQLQSLECDWISLKDGLTFLLSELDTTVQPPVLVDAGHGSLISQVRVLDVAPTLADQDETASLLSQTAGLQMLLLRAQATAGYPMACPLDSLNSASFGTLSQLTLRICVGIAGSGLELALPYGFAWTDALSKMHELEKFELHLEYEGYFDISATSFGDQWGDIPELLADSNRMPKLKDVGISVTARVIEEEEGDEGQNKKDAEAFLEKVQAVVYPRWFLPLKARQEKRDLDVFSYNIELSEVPENSGLN